MGELSTVVLPVYPVLLGGAAFTAYYSWRVTGNALEFPYQLY